MVRGFYTAASGMLTQEKKLNVYAQNIANASTSGYKKENLVSGTFGEHLAVRMNAYGSLQQNEIGAGVFMQTVADSYMDYTQGAYEQTERPLDMAIEGEGFFVVANDDGEFLTRTGQFELDAEGFLTLPEQGRVQGEGGEIYLGNSDFLVARDGNIYLSPQEEGEEAELVDRLMVVVPADYAAMQKTATGLFEAEDFQQVEETGSTKVIQFVKERSNVDMAEEMMRVMSSQRGLQSASQLLKIYDQLNEKANSQLAKL